MSFERANPEQRRDRFLRLAEKARDRATETPAMQQLFLQVAESWDLMARSAMEVSQLRAGANHNTTYRRVRNWLRQNIGHCCCDDCISVRVGALEFECRALTAARFHGVRVLPLRRALSLLRRETHRHSGHVARALIGGVRSSV